MNKIKVLIADDHSVVRMGLAALLGAEDDIEVVGEAKNGDEAVSQSVLLMPDVVVMDLVMPKKDGIAATAELREKLPSAKVLVLTSYSTSDGIAHAIDAGAAGALMKSAENETLIEAIRSVHAGRQFIPASIRRLTAGDTFINYPRPLQRRHCKAARHQQGQRQDAHPRALSETRCRHPCRSRRHSVAEASAEDMIVISILQAQARFSAAQAQRHGELSLQRQCA